MNIIGHQHILDYFQKTIANGALHHAYCFVGISGLGKCTFAQSIAASLLGVEASALRLHPDFRLIEQRVDEKTGKTKKNIPIEEIRECREFLSGRPFVAQRQAVIIDGADTLSPSASNALLKILEEPPKTAYFFLIAEEAEALPETIRSRCHVVPFTPLPTSAIVDGLLALGYAKEEALEWAKSAYGRPGQALLFAKEPEAFSRLQEKRVEFSSLFGKAFAEKRRALAPLFSEKGDHGLARERLASLFGLWEMFLRDKMVNGESGSFVLPLFSEIEKGRSLLLKNVHPELILDTILLAIP